MIIHRSCITEGAGICQAKVCPADRTAKMLEISLGYRSGVENVVGHRSKREGATMLKLQDRRKGYVLLGGTYCMKRKRSGGKGSLLDQEGKGCRKSSGDLRLK